MSLLNSIVSNSDTYRPQKIICYGTQGLGKSTFGATFENPILLRTEDSGSKVDVATFPIITSVEELIAICNALYNEEHQFKTAILDTADWLEPLIWSATASKHGKSSIEDFGYGKGYLEADSEWRLVMGWLDALRVNRNMTLVILAHSEIKRFEPPDSDQYDRYQMKLHKRAWALWQEWADIVLFAGYRTRTIKTKDGGKSGQDKFRGDGVGERMLYTEERPAYFAKNRWSLPSEILIGKDETWSAFHKALNVATNGRYALPVKA